MRVPTTNRSPRRALLSLSLHISLVAACVLGGPAWAQTPAPQSGFDGYVGERPEAVLLHRIERGQTLAKILQLIYQDGTSPSMASVVARNPQSFVNGDVTRPIAGTTLRLPIDPTPAYTNNAETYSSYESSETTTYRAGLPQTGYNSPEIPATPAFSPSQAAAAPQFRQSTGYPNPADVASPAVTPLGAQRRRLSSVVVTPRTPVVGAIELLSGALIGQDIDGNRRSLSEGDAVHGGDRLILRAGRSKVRLLDGSQIFLRDQSDIVVQQLEFKDNDLNRGRRVVSLAKGGLRIISGLLQKDASDADKPDIRTPVAVIGVRGTETVLHFCPNESCMTERGEVPAGLLTGLASGEILLGNTAGSSVLAPDDVYKVPDAVTAPEPAPEYACIMLGKNCEQDAPVTTVCHERLSSKGIGTTRRHCRDAAEPGTAEEHPG